MLQKQIVTSFPHERAAPSRIDHGRGEADVRYAIYFAPAPDSAWWHFGCAWLGRDPVADVPITQPEVATIDAAYLTRITAAPRRYGFHATLKAPFRLAPEHAAREVYLQAANLACSWVTAQLPPLKLCVLDGFVALGFAPGQTGTGAAHAIAAQCVSCFDNLRARPSATELARRHAAGLTPRQSSLLREWGYPYVFDEFRFHLTLTGHLPPEEQQHVMQTLGPMVDALNSQPLALDAISVYVQPARDAPFVVTRRYGFDGNIEIYRNDP